MSVIPVFEIDVYHDLADMIVTIEDFDRMYSYLQKSLHMLNEVKLNDHNDSFAISSPILVRISSDQCIEEINNNPDNINIVKQEDIPDLREELVDAMRALKRYFCSERRLFNEYRTSLSMKKEQEYQRDVYCDKCTRIGKAASDNPRTAYICMFCFLRERKENRRQEYDDFGKQCERCCFYTETVNKSINSFVCKSCHICSVMEYADITTAFEKDPEKDLWWPIK